MQASLDQSVNLSLSSHTIGNAVDPSPPPPGPCEEDGKNTENDGSSTSCCSDKGAI